MNVDREIIQEMDQTFSKMEASLLAITEKSNKIYNKTTKVVKTVFTLIGVFIILNFYFIFDFSQDVIKMIDDMEGMYTHFGKVTHNVHLMTEDVSHMGGNIALMPQIAKKMSEMNQHVTSMSKNVTVMNKDVTSMKQNVNAINGDMTSMSHRFNRVNQSVANMRYDVKQMSDVVPR